MYFEVLFFRISIKFKKFPAAKYFHHQIYGNYMRSVQLSLNIQAFDRLTKYKIDFYHHLIQSNIHSSPKLSSSDLSWGCTERICVSLFIVAVVSQTKLFIQEPLRVACSGWKRGREELKVKRLRQSTSQLIPPSCVPHHHLALSTKSCYLVVQIPLSKLLLPVRISVISAVSLLLLLKLMLLLELNLLLLSVFKVYFAYQRREEKRGTKEK